MNSFVLSVRVVHFGVSYTLCFKGQSVVYSAAVGVYISTYLVVWLSGSLVREEALTVPLPGRERRPLADWVSWGISPRP